MHCRLAFNQIEVNNKWNYDMSALQRLCHSNRVATELICKTSAVKNWSYLNRVKMLLSCKFCA